MIALFAQFKLYIIAGAIAVLLSGIWYAHHHVYEQGRAAQLAIDTPKLELLRVAQDVNEGNAKVLVAVQASAAACEAGRIADAQEANRVTAERNLLVVSLTAKAKASQARLADELKGRCKAWADQPACISVQP